MKIGKDNTQNWSGTHPLLEKLFTRYRFWIVLFIDLGIKPMINTKKITFLKLRKKNIQ